MEGLNYKESYERKLGQNISDYKANWEYYERKAKQAKAQYESLLAEQESHMQSKVLMREL